MQNFLKLIKFLYTITASEVRECQAQQNIHTLATFYANKAHDGLNFVLI